MMPLISSIALHPLSLPTDKSFVPVHGKPLKAVTPCGRMVCAVKSRTDALSFDTSTTSMIVGRILLVAHIFVKIDEAWYQRKRRPAATDPRYCFVPDVGAILQYWWIPVCFIVEQVFMFTP